MSLTFSPRYTSVACGRSPHAADWNNNGIICYAASNVVVLCDTNTQEADPITILSHHRSKVNAVKWIQNGTQHPNELVSCSGDKTAIIWSCKEDVWVPSAVLEGHSDGVTCADGLYISSSETDSLLVYTASIDSTVRIWKRQNGVVGCRQTISLGSGLCLALRATFLPGSRDPLLFCAFDDDKIYLFTECEERDNEYHKVSVLVGHEDWVRGLDVITLNDSSLLLASCSQDTYVRLWSVARREQRADGGGDGGVRVDTEPFVAHAQAWGTRLEAVLAGHEGWVYSVHWHPPVVEPDGSVRPVLKLLSSSLDKSLIVWEQAGGAGSVWEERVRVGEVGGSGLGFYGGRFGPAGASFLGHGYSGAFHVWKWNEESEQWMPWVLCGGHFGEVADVRWELARGRYLVSGGSDQTTRAHAPCGERWREVARPQVHGYDVSALALVSSVELVSGAEEKVIRVFRAPHSFVNNFRNLTHMQLVQDGSVKGPEGASVPSLGLSNKAVFMGEDGNADDGDCDRYFVPVNLTEPPTEDSLLQSTLWPETHKLYGHGYEVYALDASADGTLLASACRASAPDHAAILLWDTKEWQQVQKLPSHQLTVTQLAFSPDSERLLSVSRDRRWSLFRRSTATTATAGSPGEYRLEAASDKSNGVHGRIVWCCAWSHDAAYFATGSRDGKICVWSDIGNTKESSLGGYGLAAAPLELANSSVTALAFAPVDVNKSKLLAVGFELGNIRMYLFTTAEWTLALELDQNRAHHLTVRRLTFRPVAGVAGDEREAADSSPAPAPAAASRTLQLASCGSDHLVRIYDLALKDKL